MPIWWGVSKGTSKGIPEVVRERPGEAIGPPDAPARGEEDHTRTLGGAVRAVSGMTLLSRVGGLARDVIVGRIFGDTAVNSAFAAAFAIPNMFRRLLGEGALSAAFIPEYTGASKEANGKGANEQIGEADALASLTVLALGIATGVITVVVEVVLLVLLVLLPHDAERALSLRLIMVMLPFMPLICVTAILAGMLQVHGRFAASASGPLVLNGFIIAVGSWSLATGTLAREPTAYLLGVATVLSGLTQAIWFARLLHGSVRWTWHGLSKRQPVAQRMLRRFVPVMIGQGTLQLNAFLDTLIAMWPIWVGPTVLGLRYPLDDRSNGILSLTTRLYQFPLGVFGIAVATAAFPMLSRHASDPALFASTLRRGLRLSLFIGLPASVGLVLVREPITTVLFSGGSGKTGFSTIGLARSAAVLLGFAPAIWAYSLNHVFTRAFYARGDTRTPMNVGIGMVALNLALNLTLIWPLQEAGLAWSTSMCAMVQCVVLGVLCHRKLGAAGVDAPTARAFARLALAAAVMGAAVVAVQRVLPAGTGWRGSLVSLGVSCATGLAAYGAATALLRGPELGWLLKRN